MIRFACLLATLLLGLSAAAAAERTVIVLDASGSMWGQIDGRPKLEIARQALRDVLRAAPADSELGLMAYGHREKGSCEDIQMVVPPARGTAAAITSAVDAMKFLGSTPLSAAVRKAAEDLNYTQSKATVVLITDGLESCEADPCALGKELEQAGADFTAHVVGFGLTAEEGRQVACLAENTGGRYVQATDAVALGDALKQTVAAAPAPQPPTPQPVAPPAVPPRSAAPAAVEFNFAPQVVMKSGGEPLQRDGQTWRIYEARPDGSRGVSVATEYDAYKGNLEPGDYVVEAILDYARAEQKVKVEAGRTASPVFDLNAGTVTLRPRPAPGAGIDRGAMLKIEYPGADGAATEYGERRLVLPAGETRVTVQIGSGEVSESFRLAAGQVLEKDIIVGVGRAAVDAFYAPGGEKVASGDLSWRIYKAARKPDGARDQVAHDYGPGRSFDLPAGDYVAVAQMQGVEAEQPFSIAVGGREEVAVSLGAGVLTVSAPGASEIRILEAGADGNDERAGVTYGYGDRLETALAAGDYVVVAAKGGTNAETRVTIKAGERRELTVP